MFFPELRKVLALRVLEMSSFTKRSRLTTCLFKPERFTKLTDFVPQLLVVPFAFAIHNRANVKSDAEVVL